MNNQFVIASLLIVIVLIIILIVWLIKKHNSIKDFNKYLSDLFPDINKANDSYEKLVNSNTYINNYKLFTYKNEYSSLYENIDASKFEKLAKPGNIKTATKQFIETFSNIDDLIEKYNSSFVHNELKSYSDLFDDIEGKKLDSQQRNAIVVDEDNALIVAGAGSGKTTTIAGKVKYLVERYNIKPSEILLIAFTRKAADEMRERIKNKLKINIEVKTFHKLGLDIISEVNNEKASILDMNQRQSLDVFASFINDAKEDKTYFDVLTNFFVYWLKPYKPEEKFETEGERTSYLIDQKYDGLKVVTKNSGGKVVTYREKLKSQEEVLIANFLFTNNIEYKYEESYKYKTASKKFGQYKPDFYLPEYDIYIEHFAIDKNYNVPPWFKGDEHQSAREKYVEGIKWKRQEHKINNTTLIETYSWEQKEGKLLKNLEKKLKSHGVELHPKSNEEIWEYLSENSPVEIDNFTVLIYTFLSLLKSNNVTIEHLYSLAEKENDERASLFLYLFEPIKKMYDDFLEESKEIDFNDMINNATSLVSSNLYKSPYKYIIIDEFQDISFSRYDLIKSLLDNRPETKLFCVGDDWQSIYRFTGSDIGIFTDFEKHFSTSSIQGYNRKTHKSNIEYTYRFDNQLIELSSSFILKNPNQLHKNLKSHKQSHEKPYTVFYYDFNSSIINPLNKAIADIGNRSNGKNTSILLLGRYSHEINEIKEKNYLQFRFDTKTRKTTISYPGYPNLKFSFNTVHSAKGLEADYIIILNGNSGKYGFPTEISDDPLLNFLLSKADQFPNGEERRLFYVALTRTRNHVYILSNKEAMSKFIKEIEVDEKIHSNNCPWCDLGTLIERKGPYGYFYSCSNVHYCNYTEKISESVFIKKAAVLRKENDIRQAISYYTKALEINDKNYLVYYERGMCHLQAGDTNNAFNDFYSVLNLNNRHANSWYYLAKLLYDKRDYKKAADYWAKAYNIDNTSHVNSIFWYAKCQYNLSNYSRCIKALDKYLKLKPKDADGYQLRGECYLKTNQPWKANVDFETAERLQNDSLPF